MAFTRSLLLCGALALAGCGGGLSNSWVNPSNWFGKSSNEALAAGAEVNPLIPKARAWKRKKAPYQGTAVDQIKSLRIERRPGGAIIHVVAIADGIGYYDVRMQSDTDGKPENGVLTYTLRAERPAKLIRGGNEAARRITAARYVTDQDLEGVRKITVKGARNQSTTSRR